MRIRGYFSIFGNVDQAGDVVDPGAFTDWILANPKARLPIYWDHDHRWGTNKKPIGVTTTIRETERGAYFEGSLAETQKGQDVGHLIDIGAARQTSFAFKTIDKYKSGKVWHLARLEPAEITVAAIGAVNPLAFVEPYPAEENEG